MRPGDRWIPWYIVAFFVFFMVLLTGFAWIAFHTYSGEVTKDAYKKGLAYNTTIANADTQKQLGWKSTIATTFRGKIVEIMFTLHDKNDKPMSDAGIVASLVRPTEAGYDKRITLHSHGEGVYHGNTYLDFSGVWNLQISATSEGHNYQKTKTIQMP